MSRRRPVKVIAAAGYVAFVAMSLAVGFEPGTRVARHCASFALDMLKILPGAFVLIGLFEVWAKRELVVRHLGHEAGILGYVWAVLLAGTTVGGLYVAFPVAYALQSKGARLSVIFTYVGASAICRVPLTIFEASFMGMKFTVVRLAVSLPLVIVSATFLERYLAGRGYQIVEGK